MEKKERDEHLETIWHLIENNESDVDSFRSHSSETFDEGILENLRADGYITLRGDQISLTEKGNGEAQQIIRRHRLAERLLTDVLGMALGDIEPGACEFEHVLAPELVDSICTLLGHPRECPHGGSNSGRRVLQAGSKNRVKCCQAACRCAHWGRGQSCLCQHQIEQQNAQVVALRDYSGGTGIRSPALSVICDCVRQQPDCA